MYITCNGEVCSPIWVLGSHRCTDMQLCNFNILMRLPSLYSIAKKKKPLGFNLMSLKNVVVRCSIYNVFNL